MMASASGLILGVPEKVSNTHGRGLGDLSWLPLCCGWDGLIRTAASVEEWGVGTIWGEDIHDCSAKRTNENSAALLKTGFKKKLLVPTVNMEEDAHFPGEGLAPLGEELELPLH